MICPRCQFNNNPREQYCQNCGLSLQDRRNPPRQRPPQRQAPQRERARRQEGYYAAPEPPNRSKQKNPLKLPLIIISALAVIFLLALIIRPSGSSDDIQDLKAEIKTLEKENKELRNQLESRGDVVQEQHVDVPAEENQGSAQEAPKMLGLGEDWIVEGQWRLRIDSVTTTDERNEFSDKDPAQVVVVKYTYENLGYESDFMDLYFTPDRVIDGQKKMAETYPAGQSVYPQETPIGAVCEGAEESFGLMNASDTIQIIFEKYDANSNRQRMTFEVPVQ